MIVSVLGGPWSDLRGPQETLVRLSELSGSPDDPGILTHTIAGLQAGTRYEVTLHSVSRRGKASANSEPLSVQTKEKAGPTIGAEDLRPLAWVGNADPKARTKAALADVGPPEKDRLPAKGTMRKAHWVDTRPFNGLPAGGRREQDTVSEQSTGIGDDEEGAPSEDEARVCELRDPRENGNADGRADDEDKQEELDEEQAEEEDASPSIALMLSDGHGPGNLVDVSADVIAVPGLGAADSPQPALPEHPEPVRAHERYAPQCAQCELFDCLKWNRQNMPDGRATLTARGLVDSAEVTVTPCPVYQTKPQIHGDDVEDLRRMQQRTNAAVHIPEKFSGGPARLSVESQYQFRIRATDPRHPPAPTTSIPETYQGLLDDLDLV